MGCSKHSLLILTLGFVASAVQAANYPTRSWTNDQGEKIEARLERVSGSTVMLRQDGKVVRAPMDRLSQADQDWIATTKRIKRWREWTMADGTQRRARFVDYRRGKIELKDESESFSVTLDKLSDADRRLVMEVFCSGMGGLDGTSKFTAVEKVTREWTDFSGKKIEAEFRGADGEKVVLFFKDREWRVPMWRFSNEDMAFVAQAQQQALQHKTGQATSRDPARLGGTRPNVEFDATRESMEREFMDRESMEREFQQRDRQREERFDPIDPDRVPPEEDPRYQQPARPLPAGGRPDSPSRRIEPSRAAADRREDEESDETARAAADRREDAESDETARAATDRREDAESDETARAAADRREDAESDETARAAADRREDAESDETARAAADRREDDELDDELDDESSRAAPDGREGDESDESSYSAAP